MEIEKGVPVPASGKSVQKILDAMEVGDSVACDEKNRRRLMQSAMGASFKRSGKKFISRVLDKEADKCRVWRVK